jgi:hypothetical protein
MSLTISMFNRSHLIKYVVMFIVVTLATKIIPTCGVLQKQAVYVGLIASATLALLDICFPRVIMKDKEI